MKKTFDIIQKIIFILTDIIIILLLAIWTYYTFQVHINKVPKEEVFNYTVFVVSTGSMENTINVNDVILVEITKNVKEKDIIAFKQDNGLIVHRIISINDEGIITKGDANNHEDEPINLEQIIGKVIKVIPAKNIVLIILGIILLNVLLAIVKEIWIKDNFKERQKISDEK